MKLLVRCLCNEHHMFGLSTSESVILAVYSAIM